MPLAIQHDEHKNILMNSKIRIEHDFEHNESFIEINLEHGDNNDRALKNFVEQVNNRGVEQVYPKANQDNKTIYLRPMIAQDRELFIVRQFKHMCKESLPSELYEAFEPIYDYLFQTRSALIDKQGFIE